MGLLLASAREACAYDDDRVLSALVIAPARPLASLAAPPDGDRVYASILAPTVTCPEGPPP
jgi:hypothetical protein